MEVDPNVEGQIRQLRERAKEEAEARKGGTQTQWLMPTLEGEWDGDLFDIEGISESFNRDGANDKFEEATKDAEDSGVVGDLVSATLQVDFMACMERAFRQRHTMRRPRTFAHMAARRQGHGNERGTLTQTNLEFIRNIIKQSQAQSSGGNGDG
jgi:hypothetical protein